MLKKVVIRNFLTCRNVKLDSLRPVVALVGRNATGKTNILRAIEWATDQLRLLTPHRWAPKVRQPGTAQVQLEVKLGSENYRCRVDKEVMGREGGVLAVEKRREGRWVSDLDLSDKDPYRSCLSTAGPSIVSFLEGIRYYALDEPTVPAPSTPQELGIFHKSEVEDEDSFAFHDTVPALLIHDKTKDPETFEIIRWLAGPKSLGLIDDISTDESRSRYHVMFVKQGQPLYFAELSAGTRRVLRLLTALLHDRSSVMLLEHPEDGIHPGLLTKLVETLKAYSDQTQIIMASHSPRVLDCLDPEEIRLVDMDDENTIARKLTKKERDNARWFLSEAGPLSEYLQILESV